MLKADYLVIGAGAMGMAFADSIIHNTCLLYTSPSPRYSLAYRMPWSW